MALCCFFVFLEWEAISASLTLVPPLRSADNKRTADLTTDVEEIKLLFNVGVVSRYRELHPAPWYNTSIVPWDSGWIFTTDLATETCKLLLDDLGGGNALLLTVVDVEFVNYYE